MSKIHNIEWKKIIGMRNVVVHAYGTIDENILWETCKYQVEELKKTIINSLETGKE